MDLVIVPPEHAGKRLDRLLTDFFPSYSRTYFQYLIERGSVLLNGKKVKKRQAPEEGDEIEVCFELTPEIALEGENIPLDILFEDDHLLAINKPPQMVVHPAPGNYTHTFVNALLYHCRSLPEGSDKSRPGIVHRLDKDTTGVLLAAKTSEAHRNLVEMFSERRIKKFYQAICVGNPGDGLIDAPIRRHPILRKEMSVDPSGKEALSHCRVLETAGELSLVEVQLITGRTHQIRVHLKHKNAPVLGDPIYGSIKANKRHQAERQLLHAAKLILPHPITGRPMEIIAPTPDDMTGWKKHLNH